MRRPANPAERIKFATSSMLEDMGVARPTSSAKMAMNTFFRVKNVFGVQHVFDIGSVFHDKHVFEVEDVLYVKRRSRQNSFKRTSVHVNFVSR